MKQIDESLIERYVRTGGQLSPQDAEVVENLLRESSIARHIALFYLHFYQELDQLEPSQSDELRELIERMGE